MTTTDHPINDARPPWSVLDEFRLGAFFVRVMTRPNGGIADEFEFILASTAAGLDDPLAFRFENPWQLGNAIRIAEERAVLAVASDERGRREFRQMFRRLGAVGLHEEPPPWAEIPWLYPEDIKREAEER